MEKLINELEQAKAHLEAQASTVNGNPGLRHVLDHVTAALVYARNHGLPQENPAPEKVENPPVKKPVKDKIFGIGRRKKGV